MYARPLSPPWTGVVVHSLPNGTEESELLGSLLLFLLTRSDVLVEPVHSSLGRRTHITTTTPSPLSTPASLSPLVS